MSNLINSTLVMLVLAACISCTSPVDTQESGVNIPALWNGAKGSNELLVNEEKAKVEHDWWKHFEDPTLDALIVEALKNNKNLAIAKARVMEAKANRGIANAQLLPSVNGKASSQRGNQGFFTQDKIITINEATVEASWELDLFGGNQARSAAAKAILQSTEASQKAVLVSLLAEVARTYFDLRNYEKQIAITNRNLENQRKTLSLIQEQFNGALVSDFDVQRAGAQVSETESQLPALQSAYTSSLNRLNVLLGAAPGEKNALIQPAQEYKNLDAKIIIAAPATVIRTRPDVTAAERQLAAAISTSDAAFSEFFPKISLLGFFGVQDTSAFSSQPWNLAGNIVQPLLNFGAISSLVDAADARQQQAFLAYQQTVLESLEDMENSLANYSNETKRNHLLMKSVEQNSKASELAREQFTNGDIGLLDVLVTERNVLTAESNLASSDTKLRKDLVNIYTAAGGGWEGQ